MNWNGIFKTWKTTTRINKLRTLALEEMELDSRFLILHTVLQACTNIIHAQV